MKTVVLFFTSLCFVFLSTGCETARCIKTGKCYPIDGMCRDIKNFVSSPDGSLYDVTDEFDSAQDYYRQKLYREALFHYYAFLDFVGKECKCDKQIEEAKYKIAKCYLALNSNEAAMQALKAYLDEFPKGKYSREALKEYRKIHLAAGGL